MVKIPVEDLDINNGFTCVQLVIPDIGGAAQVGGALYILVGARYQSSIPADAKVATYPIVT